MKYPMKQVFCPILGERYREMTPAEYDERIKWYRDYIKRYANDKARKQQDYVSYLRRWFGSGPCDGLPNFKARHTLHQLPMSFNVYTYE